MVTRTFTEAEEEVLTRCLLACRPAVTAEDRAVIDGIIRDGWVRIGQPAGSAPSITVAGFLDGLQAGGTTNMVDDR